MTSPRSDQDHLCQESRRDQERFRRELVGALPRLWRFAGFLTGSREASEDLVQSTCERALARRHQWLAETRLESWVMAIMQSIWKNQLRAQCVRVGNGLVDPETHLTHDGNHSMEIRLRTRELAEAATRLSEDQRVLLYVVYVQGHSYREAAMQLEVPLGTVMSRLARARVVLTDRVGRRGGLPPGLTPPVESLSRARCSSRP